MMILYSMLTNAITSRPWFSELMQVRFMLQKVCYRILISYADCKMCVVLQNVLFFRPTHLDKGMLHPRCIPMLWCISGFEPSLHQQIVSPINHSQDLENCLSTCTEPCINNWLLNHQSWESPSSPDNPMVNGDFIHP